jgi:hypothetical protein
MNDRPLSFVTVYHNVGDDSFSGYRPGHPLISVFAYKTPAVDDAVIIGDAYEMFNIGENGISRAYRARRLRSLSFPGNSPCCSRSCCLHRRAVWPRSSSRPAGERTSSVRQQGTRRSHR